MFSTIKLWLGEGENRQKIFCITLILAVAFLSFGLGYLTNREFNHAPIVIEKHFDK